ncbi:MAG: signal peptidase I [Planctomycetaceae bacterium]
MAAGILRWLLPGWALAAAGLRRAAAGEAALFALLLAAPMATPWLHSPAGAASFLLALLLLCARSLRRSRGLPAGKVAARDLPWLAVAPLLLACSVVPALRERALGLAAYRIPSGHASAAPTLLGGERFLASRTVDPARGALVLFTLREDPATTYVRRIVALEGDRVEGGAEGIRVNGERVSSVPADAFGPLPVGRGEAFVLGENLEASRDSRHFGTIGIDTIVGRPLYVFWSSRWERIGTTLR